MKKVSALRALEVFSIYRSILVVLFMFVSILFPIARFLHRREIAKKSFDKNFSARKISRQKLLLVIPYILAVFFILFPVASWFPVPGSDAYWYVDQIFRIKELGATEIFRTRRPFVALALSVLDTFLNDWRISLLVFKIISGLIFVSGVYNFCSRINIGYAAELLGVSLAVLLPAQYLRQSYDLYASFFAYALTFVFWHQLLEALDFNSLKKEIQAAFLLVFIAFSHFETFLANLAVMAFYLAITQICTFHLHKKFDASKHIKKFVVVVGIPVITLSPFIYMSLIDPFYLGVTSRYIGPQNIRFIGWNEIFSDALPVQNLYEDRFWGIESFQDYVINRYKGHTNLPLFFLTLVGLIAVDLRKKAGRILYAWNALLIVAGALFLLKIAPINGGARLVFLLPSPIFLCLGVDALLSIPHNMGLRFSLEGPQIKSRALFISARKAIIFLLIAIFLHSILVAINVRGEFSTPWAPNIDAIKEIERLKDIYGYGNDSVILIARDDYQNKVRWAKALTGLKVYFGDPLYLIANRTLDKELIRRFGGRYVHYWEDLWRKGVLENPCNYTLVLSDLLAPPNEVERNFVVEVYPGIYEVDIDKALMWLEQMNTVYVRVRYASDYQIFSSEHGYVYLNGTRMTYDPTIKAWRLMVNKTGTYMVSDIVDNFRDASGIGGLSFNGINNYVEVVTSPSLQSPHLTIVVQFIWNGTGELPQLLCTDGYPRAGAFRLRIQPHPEWEYELLFSVLNREGYCVHIRRPIQPNVFYTVIARFDGERAYLWLNGNEISGALYGEAGSTHNFMVGCNKDAEGEWFSGRIYTIIKYNRSISDAEVKQIATGGMPPSEGLVLWLEASFYDIVGEQWTDRSEIGNQAIIHGANYIEEGFENWAVKKGCSGAHWIVQIRLIMQIESIMKSIPIA